MTGSSIFLNTTSTAAFQPRLTALSTLFIKSNPIKTKTKVKETERNETKEWRKEKKNGKRKETKTVKNHKPPNRTAFAFYHEKITTKLLTQTHVHRDNTHTHKHTHLTAKHFQLTELQHKQELYKSRNLSNNFDKISCEFCRNTIEIMK